MVYDISNREYNKKYPDIKDDKWYSNYVGYVTKLNLMQGDEKGFRPNDKMTRAEFMKILACMIENSANDEGIEGLEIKELDIELYYRLQNSGVTYAGFMVLYGSDLPSGALGIIYTDEDNIPEYSTVRQTMYRMASQIILLIDATDKKTKQNTVAYEYTKKRIILQRTKNLHRNRRSQVNLVSNDNNGDRDTADAPSKSIRKRAL